MTNPFLVVLGALLLVGGAADDRFGRQRTYLFGLGGFAAGSVVALVAPNVGVLIGARVVQGVAPRWWCRSVSPLHRQRSVIRTGVKHSVGVESHQCGHRTRCWRCVDVVAVLAGDLRR